ncbi:Protein of unknown function [Cotesia congregata]|uniref:RNase H domain-containing protein n=1 Tax=Cotesia congregata TaxID=51543 RepID=A0A8J2H9G2_COTCN|nr:Protein of unknown function [Cotesia congregata]
MKQYQNLTDKTRLLRIGHTNLTHIYLITKTDPELCPKCKEVLTVQHLMIDCRRLIQERSNEGISNDMKTILNNQDQCHQVANDLVGNIPLKKFILIERLPNTYES